MSNEINNQKKKKQFTLYGVIRHFLINIKLDYKPSIINKSNYDLIIYKRYRIGYNIHWSKIQRIVFFVNGV